MRGGGTAPPGPMRAGAPRFSVERQTVWRGTRSASHGKCPGAAKPACTAFSARVVGHDRFLPTDHRPVRRLPPYHEGERGGGSDAGKALRERHGRTPRFRPYAGRGQMLRKELGALPRRRRGLEKTWKQGAFMRGTTVVGAGERWIQAACQQKNVYAAALTAALCETLVIPSRSSSPRRVISLAHSWRPHVTQPRWTYLVSSGPDSSISRPHTGHMTCLHSSQTLRLPFPASNSRPQTEHLLTDIRPTFP